jgi:hypothetical protein
MIWFHNRIRRDLGPGYDHVFERVLARFNGQLACECADVPNDAVVLVVSGGDPELLKVRPGARHFPEGNNREEGIAAMPDGELVELLEAARRGGGQFLLIPQTAFPAPHRFPRLRRALPWRNPYGRLRSKLDRRYARLSECAGALLYDLRDQAPEEHRHDVEDGRCVVGYGDPPPGPPALDRTSVSSTKSWVLPPPVKRLREHLREIRRVASETQQQVIALDARLARIEARLDELTGAASAPGTAQHRPEKGD